MKVERGVTAPNRRRRNSHKIRDTLESLAPGDSFRIPIRRSSAVYGVAYYHGFEISIRKVGKATARVWLMA